MKHADFKAAIELAGAALGRGDLKPQLARLWFDLHTVMAWDDNVAISAACPFALEGGVKGDLLTSLVARATGEKVAVAVKGTVSTFKIGRSTLKLNLLPLEQRDFAIQAPNPKAVIPVDADLLVPALEHVLKCVGQNLEKPEYHGVTFASSGDGTYLLIYAGHPAVLVEASIPLRKKLKHSFDYVVLPEKFCRELVKHYKKEGAVLELHDATAPIGGGLLVHPDITVFGRSMSSGQNKIEMWEYIQQHTDNAQNWMGMPGDLVKMLDMAASMFEGEHHNLELGVEVSNGAARLRIAIDDGEAQLIDVSADIKGSKVKPIVVKTNAKQLHTGAKLTRISIDDGHIVMRDDREDGTLITQVVGVTAA